MIVSLFLLKLYGYHNVLHGLTEGQTDRLDENYYHALAELTRNKMNTELMSNWHKTWHLRVKTDYVLVLPNTVAIKLLTII